MTTLSLAIATFTFSLVGVLTIKQYAQSRLLDVPNHRSSHTTPTPRGGGLGFVIAFLCMATVASLGFQPIAWSLQPLQLAGLLLSLIPLATIGLLDDLGHISAKLRYGVQLGSGALAIICLGPFLGPWFPEGSVGIVLAIGLTLFGFTALVNFYNFMDGLDGLVASVTAVQLGFLTLYLQQPIWWLLVAALLGLLYWNWSPAKIFMGDVGSTVLGASVAMALMHPQGDPSQKIAALAITLPLTADAIYTLVRRKLRGENIFQAHRSHLYQRLQQSGWSHRRVAIAYLLWTVVIAGLIGKFNLLGSSLSLLLSGVLIVSGEYYLKSQRGMISQG